MRCLLQIKCSLRRLALHLKVFYAYQISLLGFMLLIFGWSSACDGEKNNTSNLNQGRSDETTIVVGFLLGAGGLGDQSFNDMTYAGLQRARADFGIRIITEEPEANPESQARAMQSLLQQQAQLIVVSGWEFTELVKQTARKHKDIRFLVNDEAVQGFPNVASTIYAQNEGSFLVGALAGWMTETGKVGFIGGMQHETINSFLRGYKQGVQYARPGTHIQVRFVAPANDFSGFENPAKGNRLARQMYAADVDIIYAVAGLTGNGIIDAARRQKKYVIGVDADQDHMAPGYVLTSMMKRMDNATYIEVEKYAKGSFENGVRLYDIKASGISLSPMRFTRKKIPAEVHRKLERVREAVKNREIVVNE